MVKCSECGLDPYTVGITKLIYKCDNCGAKLCGQHAIYCHECDGHWCKKHVCKC